LFHKKYHIKGFEDLKRVIDAGALLKLRWFGKKKVENLKRGINLTKNKSRNLLDENGAR
jgi:hypothetical protein